MNIELIDPLGRLIIEKAIKPYDSINYAQFFEFELESLLKYKSLIRGKFLKMRREDFIRILFRV